MGIKELGSFLQKNCPEAIYDIKLSDSKDKYVTIDTSLFMYKFKYSNGENFLVKFVEMINRFKINNITPIFVFDGEPPTEKCDTIESRKEKKNEYKEQLNVLSEQKNNSISLEQQNIIDEQIKKLKKKIIYVTKENINQLKYLLSMLNIPYIHENIEADLISSKLSSSNIVNMVISEDMDHLTNGTQYLIRDFNVNNNIATCYDLIKIKTKLNLTNIQFINLCVLFGCDYVKRIKGLGTVSSFSVINNVESNNIEDILAKIKQTKNIDIPEKYIEDFNNAVKIFKNEDIDLENITIHNASLLNNKIVLNQLFDNSKKNAFLYLKKNTNLSERKINNRITNIFS
jgi:flap endonuclease-1